MSSPKATLVLLFFIVLSSFQLLFLFFYFSILLAKFLLSLCRKTTSKSSDDEDPVGHLGEEEEEEEEGNVHLSVKYMEREDLVADIIGGGEALLFLPLKSTLKDKLPPEEGEEHGERRSSEDQDEIFVTAELSFCSSPSPKYEHSKENVGEEKLSTREMGANSKSTPTDPNEDGLTTSLRIDPKNNGPVADDEVHEGLDKREIGNGTMETNFSEDENFFVIVPPPLETKKFQAQEKDTDVIFRKSFTVGSTSKSSSDWRSSIKCRDSATEDPFSSSSRRSCPNWESYTVFRKYDEEMMFLDRISSQKQSETESFKGVEVCPRSFSQRIVHKFTRNKSSREISRNPYHELENAYVAQICSTWEALNRNYKNFQRLKALRPEEDPGCPGQIAQQFQQFQVLLQRYIENEPYEHGRRPEVYARMKISAPKLLQVPEFRDLEDEQREEGFGTRILSAKFIRIMEDAIRTFMNFLKGDREKHLKIFTSFFKRKQKSSVDPTHLHLVRKANEKKKMKLKDLLGTRKCSRKKKLKEDEEMEILMGLIDLKLVSRVLRMSEISEEQLHWCEEKMSKVRIWEGRLQRDSSPLFFPAH